MKFPNTIYKYRNWENPNHQRILNNQEIYFTSCNKFNDPFDSTIPVRYNLVSEDQILQYYKKHLKKAFSHLTKSEVLKKALDAVKKGVYKNPTQIELLKKYMMIKREKDFGVFSCSQIKDSILMWTHYANDHKGFCVGFNIAELMKFKEKIGVKKGILFNLYEVFYHDKYPVLIPSGTSADEFAVLEPFRIKASIWNYEQEYRLILISGTNLSLQLPDSIISEIIIGCKMPEEQKENLISEVIRKPYPIKIFQSHIKEVEYGLDFVEINF